MKSRERHYSRHQPSLRPIRRLNLSIHQSLNITHRTPLSVAHCKQFTSNSSQRSWEHYNKRRLGSNLVHRDQPCTHSSNYISTRISNHCLNSWELTSKISHFNKSTKWVQLQENKVRRRITKKSRNSSKDQLQSPIRIPLRNLGLQWAEKKNQCC